MSSNINDLINYKLVSELHKTILAIINLINIAIIINLKSI